ncbi:LysR substrate-binding domain-containing protein [Belliella pelovolcani]|uniref:DNA-binding transcriptional regulator, LysR family n=1 Tax=Belliella pelovolcani TaxID=529505 RepID=A0A1N7MJ37_9BACT|nr:LysR substrate-binding domain-containing protein [Belliella pelovolcani]SIS86082.1 DNA-binding transcriptional regulator, LysR family [Belliella pelovolcani]
MNYTLHQLMIFLKITETSSITKAAEELHLTQPAVSIQLRNLQDQFEIPLTEVVGRKLIVTDFGWEIAAAAEKIIEEVQGINYKTAAFKGLMSGKLKISVVSTGKYVMPYFLSGFLKQHPEVDLKLDVTNKAKVLESLSTNEVDFALVSKMPETINVEGIELMPNQLCLVGNKDFELSKKLYDEGVFEEITLIYREEGSGTRLYMERYLNEKKVSVRKKIVLTSNEAVKQAVLAGMGCSIMPLIGIKNELKAGSLKIIPVKDLPIETQWNLIYLKGRKFSPVGKLYLDYLEQHKDELIRENFS